MFYVLVTFYSIERHDGTTVWIVYGHLCPGRNDKFGEFESEQDAIAEAFRYHLPVMRGQNYEQVLERLSNFGDN